MLAENEIRKTKEWTLMFFFASDNPLAISVVSQLKAIKAAGFHHDANVVVQFDPYTEGTPTHIFDVNVVNKLNHKEPNIGFEGSEPFVPTLIEDKLWRDEKGADGKAIREMIQALTKGYNAPEAPDLNGKPNAEADVNGRTNSTGSSATSTAAASNGSAFVPEADGIVWQSRRKRPRELDPFVSLQKFLKFCREEYPARHYMLFILGHGVVVGNDIFLFDEHADNHSITLNEMGYVLRSFKKHLPKYSTFELVSFHSCSVSSLEVAYELKDSANYFLASEGPAFVGSWPYRQILMRIFKDLKPNPTNDEIGKTIRQIYDYCLQNSDDFLLAGYSYQLTLCDLRNIDDLNTGLGDLSNALSNALVAEDAASTFTILYSHWKAQSFFQEMYTDLYDFCFCFIERSKRIAEDKLTEPLVAIRNACAALIQKLEKPSDEKDPRYKTAFVVAADIKGPAYQYSHGLSVYFPWSRPSDDSQIMEQYATYTFHTQFHSEPGAKVPQRSWMDFLEAYFTATQRVPRGTELLWELPNAEKAVKLGRDPNATAQEILNEDRLSIVYIGEGPLGGSLAKDDPRDRTGDECSCPSFKNYPRDTRPRRERKKQAKPVPKGVGIGAAQST